MMSGILAMRLCGMYAEKIKRQRCDSGGLFWENWPRNLAGPFKCKPAFNYNILEKLLNI